MASLLSSRPEPWRRSKFLISDPAGMSTPGGPKVSGTPPLTGLGLCISSLLSVAQASGMGSLPFPFLFPSPYFPCPVLRLLLAWRKPSAQAVPPGRADPSVCKLAGV